MRQHCAICRNTSNQVTTVCCLQQCHTMFHEMLHFFERTKLSYTDNMLSESVEDICLTSNEDFEFERVSIILPSSKFLRLPQEVQGTREHGHLLLGNKGTKIK